MAMTLTSEEQHALSVEMADQHFRGIRDKSDSDIQSKAWETMSIIGLMLYEVSEADLHDSLLIVGIDISNPLDREVASTYVSLFVAADVISITESTEDSLVDLDTEIVREFITSDELRDKLDAIKTDGKFFRDILLPNAVR